MKLIPELAKICICGHTLMQHDMPSKINGVWYETGVCWYEGHRKTIHPCYQFQLDNLAYLETLSYEQEHK